MADPAIDQTAYMDVRNMSKTQQLNLNISIKSVHCVGSYYIVIS